MAAKIKSSLSLSICVLGAVAMLSAWGILVGAFDEPMTVTRKGARMAANFIDADLKEKVDPTTIKLSPQEKRTIAALEANQKKRRKSLKIGLGMVLGGLGLLIVGSAGVLAGKSNLTKRAGFAAIATGMLSELGSIVPFTAHDTYLGKLLERKKELKMLFEDRLKEQKNNELKTRLLKRRIVGEDGKLVGGKNKEYDHDKLTNSMTYTPDLH